VACDANNPDSLKTMTQNYVVDKIETLLHGPTLLFANVRTTRELDKLKEKISHQGCYPEKYVYNHQSPELLTLWAQNAFNPMMALKILDEGVDVPECSAAILLDCSEEDDRQWIQRRGRTLRVGTGTYDKAIIHDFAPAFNHNSKWIRQWWNDNAWRLREFAQDAQNTFVIDDSDSSITNSGSEPTITQRVIEVLSGISGE
jgi:superfamily II DNA or RNA helicase